MLNYNKHGTCWQKNISQQNRSLLVDLMVDEYAAYKANNHATAKRWADLLRPEMELITPVRVTNQVRLIVASFKATSNDLANKTGFGDTESQTAAEQLELACPGYSRLEGVFKTDPGVNSGPDLGVSGVEDPQGKTQSVRSDYPRSTNRHWGN